MRSILGSLAVAFCLSDSAAAQSEVAKLLTGAAQADPKAAEAAVNAALKSSDANVRGIAARIANAKQMTGLLTAMATLADREPDVNAAREEMRAVVMLGGLRQVDRAFYISDRFSKRLDADVATAAAHLGPQAIDAYFTSMLKRNVDRNDFFRVALWGQPQAVSPLAMRLLQQDKEGLQDLLFLLGFEPRLIIDTDTLAAALANTDLDVRGATVWFLLQQALKARAQFDPRLKEIIGGLRVPRDNADLIAGVELLRRAVGYPRRNFVEFRAALTNEYVQIRLFLSPAKALTLLDETERRVATDLLGEKEDRASTDPPPFVLPAALPAGLAAETMKMTGCNQGWFGHAKVQVDQRGFVTSRDLTGVNTSEACRQALDVLLQYSIVENRLVSAPHQSEGVSLVRASNGPMCFDESPVATMPTKYVYGSPSMRMPRVTQRIAPVWPAAVERKPVEVGVEVVVTTSGCVRAVRVVAPAANAAINNAALVAAQQFKFQPAMINTSPVEMLVNVGVEFH